MMLDVVQNSKSNTVHDIICQLKNMHNGNSWAFFPELRIGTGYGHDKEQRLDAWAMCLYPSRFQAPYLRKTFEIKVNRNDFLKEIKDPDKSWFGRMVSHQFWWVCSENVIKKGEIEPGDGLMIWDGKSIKIEKKAATRAAVRPRWSFVAAIARRSSKIG